MIKRGLVTLLTIISLSGCFSGTEKQPFLRKDYIPISEVRTKLSKGLEKDKSYNIYVSHNNTDYFGYLQVLCNLKYTKGAYNQETHQSEEKFLASNWLGQREIIIQRNRIRCIQIVEE